jgi:endonuclease YncB( thermonuclease family)
MLAALVAAPAFAQQVVPPPDRDVTPPNVTPGPKIDGPLERIPAPPPPPVQAKWWRFFLPVTADSATFKVEGLTIRVAGVEPPPADATCPAAGGAPWQCGQTALYSLRRFLHGRAIECYFPRVDGVDDITAPCRVGEADIGTWLLMQGWARPNGLATDEYRKTATDALCARRGIWRDHQPGADCPPPPKAG